MLSEKINGWMNVRTTKRSRSDEKGKKRAHTVLRKYFKKLLVDKQEARTYFKKKIAGSNHRATKAFLWYVLSDFGILFEDLLYQSESVTYNSKQWLQSMLEMWFGEPSLE